MKKILMTAAAVAVLAGGVTACANTNVSTSPQLTFSNYQPMTLNVGTADVVEAFTNPNDPNDVSSQFVVAPAEAIKRYAANRFRASGVGDGRFTIAIEDSRVHLRQIKQESKVLSAMDAGTEDEYRVMLVLKVISSPSGFQGKQETTIKMERTLVMRSSVALAEREMRQIRFMEQLVSDVDARIGDTLNQTPAIRN